ncbi:MAG: response regulator transcription factor [Bacillota bacterium]
MYKILIVEDDRKLCGLISDYLSRYGYEVHSSDDFRNIENIFDNINPSLLLLDVNLPYMDGFWLCRSIRRRSGIPIIIISARGADMEQVMGIESGADDYIVKPFNLEVLLAKVKSAIRRAYGEYSAYVPAEPVSGASGGIGLVLDESGFKARFGGNSTELTKNEFKLLKKLYENINSRITTREELLEELWDDAGFVDDNTLTVNVTRVRSKLAAIGLPDALKTKRGVGYFLEIGPPE